MPRLIGKKSNKPLYIGIFIMAAIVSVAALEYLGKIDLIPGFGKSSASTGRIGVPARQLPPP